MFYQIFFLPQVKRNVIISNKHGTYTSSLTSCRTLFHIKTKVCLKYFARVCSPDWAEPPKSGSARNYTYRQKLFYNCLACTKIDHLTKNCKLKTKFCPKFNSEISYNCSKTNWKCTNCEGNHSAAYKVCPSYKYVMKKSTNRQQNISYALAMCKRAAIQDIEAFKANVIINVQQLVKMITTVIYENYREEFEFIDQSLTLSITE